MTLKQVLALLGTALTIGGAFMPLATIEGYTTNLFMGGSIGGWALIILAGLSIIFAMANFNKALWGTGIGAFGYVVYVFFNFKNTLLKVVTAPDANILESVEGLTKADVFYEVSAWIMLFLGSAAILVSAIVYLPEDDEEEEEA